MLKLGREHCQLDIPSTTAFVAQQPTLPPHESQVIRGVMNRKSSGVSLQAPITSESPCCFAAIITAQYA